MAHLLRGKQAGVQRDFSAGLNPQLFAIDEVTRYGINSQISCLAYDPVQSLLAVGTNDTQYGGGQIYVFGQYRVSVALPLPRKASVRAIRFVADKLVSVDSKNEISVFSLETARILASYTPPGGVTAVVTDPTLDFALIGLQNGDVVAYDLDRQSPAPLRIPNLWKQQYPKPRPTPVVTLAFHPRDIGTFLIGYAEGAVIYSFKTDKPTKFFRYEIPPGAQGGDSDPTTNNIPRYPRLTQALWHPTGTFVLTGHEDSSLVIWDAKDGRKILARTIQNANLGGPGRATESVGSTRGPFALKCPLFRMAWCCKENPDDTGILIAGGTPTTSLEKGLTFIDLGQTPVYATSSWQILSQHFEKPKRQHTLPTPPNAEVVDFCLIPRRSPHYAGSHDPIAVIVLLSSGEMVTLSLPSGHSINPTNQLHVSLSYVHPFISRVEIAYVERTRWLGMVENRSKGPSVLKGGAEAKHPIMRFANRNILQAAHADGTVRMWDVGHGDEIENQKMLQVDVARAVGRSNDVDVLKMSMAGATGELAVGLRAGEVVIFIWGYNKDNGKEVSQGEAKSFGLETIKDRAEPGVKEGLHPLTMFKGQGQVTALKASDVGFVAAGFNQGGLVVIDLRGPAVIYQTGLDELSGQSKGGSFRRSNGQSQQKAEWPTCIEFGVMNLEGDEYSSILLFVGSNLGRVATFKLLPGSHGGYSVSFVGSTALEGQVVTIAPLDSELGDPAAATQTAVAGLRDGRRINGVLLAITTSGVKVFRPPSAKGAHKTWDDVFCDAAAVVRYQAAGYALLGLFGDGTAKTYSIPALKQIASANVGHILDVRRFSEAIITPTGDILGWTGPSEMALLNVWGTGSDLTRSLDKLLNVEALIPPRPTISNVEWMTGTLHVTPADMDALIGGPNRPPSKRMIEQRRAEEEQQRTMKRSAAAGSSSSEKEEEGYWAYMQRQMQERTQNLNIMGDSMDRVEENSSNWADDVNKFVSKQKKKAVMGFVGSKLGF
ncbi:MAG: hypothetical protein LQ343_002257 [Gyalolechia ehrenbergii]|nr:MAG: hypothetical protein LQ343_002257 [Gyalolechia ehrenbergii]